MKSINRAPQVMNDSTSSVDNEGVGLLKVPCEQRALVVGAEHS
jgi:hypothetical protein